MSDTLPPTDHDALLDAVCAVLAPLAELAVARGLAYGRVEDAMRQSFVRAAREEQLKLGLPAHRLVSRISAATGLNRREVTRLTQSDRGAPRPASASLSSLVYSRWLSEPSLQDGDRPRELPRQGEADSFEALARSVTQDVHPRTVLDELCRLRLVAWDAGRDTVTLLEDGYTPHGDWQAMLGFLAANVGDHLRAAAANVLDDAPAHFEQAVFTDGLSHESVELVRALARRHWQALMAEAVPLLEQRRVVDRQQEDDRRRVRLGLYSFHEPRVVDGSDRVARPPQPWGEPEAGDA
jgi:hypothetical protein